MGFTCTSFPVLGPSCRNGRQSRAQLLQRKAANPLQVGSHFEWPHCSHDHMQNDLTSVLNLRSARSSSYSKERDQCCGFRLGKAGRRLTSRSVQQLLPSSHLAQAQRSACSHPFCCASTETSRCAQCISACSPGANTGWFWNAWADTRVSWDRTHTQLCKRVTKLSYFES